VHINVNPFGAAVLLSALFMGILGAFVLIPIAVIQWGWNTFSVYCFGLPTINVGQAILLYLAFAVSLYLSGFRVKVETAE
jgi:hypothetical protein